METTDPFRSRIDGMINFRRLLAVPVTHLPWGVIEAHPAPEFERKDRPGQFIEGQQMLRRATAPVGAGRRIAEWHRTPTHLTVSLPYPRHSFNRSDEDDCERWSEIPLWRFFGGRDRCAHSRPCDATQPGRLRRDIDDDGVDRPLKATIDTAFAGGIVKLEAQEPVALDTAVQEKAIAQCERGTDALAGCKGIL